MKRSHARLAKGEILDWSLVYVHRDQGPHLAKVEILEGKPGSFASEPYDLYTLGPCPASSIYLTLRLGLVACKPGCPWAKLLVHEPKFQVFGSVLG